jgi:hypothetical protein
MGEGRDIVGCAEPARSDVRHSSGQGLQIQLIMRKDTNWTETPLETSSLWHEELKN